MKKLLVLLLVLSSPTLLAESSGNWWQFWKSGEGVTEAASLLFTQSETQVLRDYLKSQARASREESSAEDNQKKSKNKGKNKGKDKGKKPKKQKTLPPGLQKKLDRGGELPPGWQKKVARGEVLDGDLYSSSRELPRSIYDRLPKGPKGTSVRQIDDRVVRIRDATRVILDVLGSQ